jgi:pyridoxine kinase
VGRAVLVSSVRQGARIGAVFADADGAWLASHAMSPTAPKGTGDLLTALAAAALIGGFPEPDALALAVSGVADAICAAAGLDELPVTALPTSLASSPLVRLDGVDD